MATAPWDPRYSRNLARLDNEVRLAAAGDLAVPDPVASSASDTESGLMRVSPYEVALRTAGPAAGAASPSEQARVTVETRTASYPLRVKFAGEDSVPAVRKVGTTAGAGSGYPLRVRLGSSDEARAAVTVETARPGKAPTARVRMARAEQQDTAQ